MLFEWRSAFASGKPAHQTNLGAGPAKPPALVADKQNAGAHESGLVVVLRDEGRLLAADWG